MPVRWRDGCLLWLDRLFVAGHPGLVPTCWRPDGPGCRKQRSARFYDAVRVLSVLAVCRTVWSEAGMARERHGGRFTSRRCAASCIVTALGMTMDVTGLAAFLAPFLPALVKGAERLATDAADRFGDAAFGVAKRMWELLRPKVEEDPRVQDTVEEVAEEPDDPALQAMLAKRLEKLLTDDAALAADVRRLFDEARAANLVAASGERSVAVGRDVSGTVITGDDVVVTGDDIRTVGSTDSRGRSVPGGDPPPEPPS
jgi:hypothetical protein